MHFFGYVRVVGAGQQRLEYLFFQGSESQAVKEILLINISGEDKPGLTATITETLAGFEVNILDIGQAVIHDTLSLGVLVELPDSTTESSILKDILFRTYELGLHVRFTPISEESYGHWVSGQGLRRFIITLLARKVTARHLSRVTHRVLADGTGRGFSRCSGAAFADTRWIGSR